MARMVSPAQKNKANDGAGRGELWQDRGNGEVADGGPLQKCIERGQGHVDAHGEEAAFGKSARECAHVPPPDTSRRHRVNDDHEALEQIEVEHGGGQSVHTKRGEERVQAVLMVHRRRVRRRRSTVRIDAERATDCDAVWPKLKLPK